MKNIIIEFHGLKFIKIDSRLLLVSCFGSEPVDDEDLLKFYNFVEVQIAGENHDVHGGNKQFLSSEWKRLKYIGHEERENKLLIVQASDFVQVKTHIQSYPSTNALRIWNEVLNISLEKIVLESVSGFNFLGLGNNDLGSLENLYLYRFHNSWHQECQPRRLSFFESGLTPANFRSMKRLFGANNGSWSTKEELPQAIIENQKNNSFLMFQIESNSGWYWEIGENIGQLYLFLGGPNQQFHSWSRTLEPGESFETVKVALAHGRSLNHVLGEITKYRRSIIRDHPADQSLPTIFNEYMHLSWDNPTAENTAKIAPVISKLGIDYYVIDCGWHNEEDGWEVYPYVGQWIESKKRFPAGIKKTIDLIHSLGMKAGLWLEPEIIGHRCREMLEYYDEDCFLHRNKKRILVMGRYFLNFKNQKVLDYLNETIRRMVEDYGVDYIKFDYNEDLGIGCKDFGESLGDGLLENSRAYLEWAKSVMDKYPNLIIETCSSGGQRLDYLTMSLYPLVSTSDQTRYNLYPYIAGNILSAVLPEQAAVWSYPVASDALPNEFMEIDSREINEKVTDEIIVMNMINAFLGRMHLASHIELLNQEKRELIAEGINYYKRLSAVKKEALPYFPLGFTDFSKPFVASGLKTADSLYLAVWNLKGPRKVKIPVGDLEIESIKVAYPEKLRTKWCLRSGSLEIDFTEKEQARFFEIKLK